tara:strand:- start:436 stop:741 length:306 start_codon:yes stop_codon:yes gene_type:complete
MNKEKELLLALLIEKYTQPKTAIEQPVKQNNAKRKRNRDFRADHVWTAFEKEKVVYLRDKGETWIYIAKQLGLREGQVKSAWSNLHIDQLDNIRQTIKQAI